MPARSRTQITIRIDGDTFDQLSHMAEEKRLSINIVAGAFIDRALRDGWTVTPNTAPAVAELTSEQRLRDVLHAYADTIGTDPEALEKIRQRIEEES